VGRRPGGAPPAEVGYPRGVAIEDRTPVWEEPVRGSYIDPGTFGALAGIDLLRRFTSGLQLPPPVGYLFGLLVTEVGPNSATFTMPATPWLAPPHGVLTGATLALLVDGPLGCAVQTVLPAATPYTTSELSLSFIRPVLPDGRTLSGKARLVHAGRTVLMSEGTVTDAGGQLVAICSTRCVTLPAVDLPEAMVRQALAVPLQQVEPDWPSPHPYQRPVQGTVQPQSVFDRLSGLQVLRGCATGELARPPIHHLTGLRPTRVEEGFSEWVMPATEWLCSPVEGRLYGGAIAFLAGNACDGATITTAEPGTAIAPVDLKVYFVRPISPDGRDMTARGRVVHRGRRVALASAEVFDADGKLAATAVSSSMILPGRPATLGRPIVDEELA
jgi:uncharacterized protein (TIGR00369 family)